MIYIACLQNKPLNVYPISPIDVSELRYCAILCGWRSKWGLKTLIRIPSIEQFWRVIVWKYASFYQHRKDISKTTASRWTSIRVCNDIVRRRQGRGGVDEMCIRGRCSCNRPPTSKLIRLQQDTYKRMIISL